MTMTDLIVLGILAVVLYVLTDRVMRVVLP